MKQHRILSLCLTLLLTWGISPALAEEPSEPYLFKLSESAPALLSAENAPPGISPVAYTDGYFTADTRADLQPLLDAGLVAYAVPDVTLTLFNEPMPNDPALFQQWYVNSLDMPAAWNAGLDGSGVKVAVIDSGLYKEHEDLAEARLSGYNFLGGKSNDPEAWGDKLGHGTLVTGLLAAQTNNALGVAGLADEANVLALRCFSGATGGAAESGNGSVSSILKAIGYAMEQNADVINMSFGGSNATVIKPLEEQLEKAAEQGILLVAAVGNDGTATLQYPAAFSCVTGVGNVKGDGSVASTSQRNSSVYVTAPGTSIYGLGYHAAVPYRADSGTSFSAPIVAALAALVKQADRDINNDGFRTLLRECAQDRGAVGYDTDYGYGTVSVRRLVEALQKERVITYERNGGTESQALPVSYTILRNPLTIPAATKPGYLFRGWFADSGCTGAALTQVPGGSVGDLTLYAGWTPDTGTDASVKCVTAVGVTATVGEADSFAAVLPYGTMLSALTAEQISVVPHNPLAVVTKPNTVDQGATWRFTVAGKSYTLHLTVAAAVAPTIADGQATQNGSATPASYDGLTVARSYTAKMGSWFSESGLTWRAMVTGGGGTVQTEGETLTYTPVFADGGKTVIVQVYAQNAAGITSVLPVTVSISVGELPASQSKLTAGSASYDLYVQKDGISVNLQLYGNRLTAVKEQEKVLAAGADYELSSRPTVEGNDDVCMLHHSYLSSLAVGEHHLTFVFDGGRAADFTVAVTTSKPSPSPPASGGGTVAPPTPDFVLFRGSNVRFAYTLDKSGTAKLTMDAKELEALAQRGIPAKFNLSEVEQVSGISLSQESLKIVAKTGVELTLPFGVVRLDGAALTDILKQAGGKTLTVSVAQVDSKRLSSAEQAMLGGAPVFDLTILSNGNTISHFNGGTATVSVPYTLKAGENPEFITIWLLDDSGKLIPMAAEYAEGKVTFTTGHFSRYAVGYLPFTDVERHWSYENIVYAYNNHLFSGVGENKFAATDQMNRAMLWLVLYRMAGSPGQTDAPATWYADAQKWATAENISDGTRPEDKVTREQLATILYRHAKATVATVDMSSFTDTAEISTFATDGMDWAVANGILNGYGGKLNPQGSATRAEVAAMLRRFDQKTDLPT